MDCFKLSHKNGKDGAYKNRKRRKGMRIFLFAYIAPNERVYDDLVKAESQRLAIIEFQRRNGKNANNISNYRTNTRRG